MNFHVSITVRRIWLNSNTTQVHFSSRVVSLRVPKRRRDKDSFLFCSIGEDKCVCLYRVWSDKAKAPQCLYQYRGHESHVVSLRWHHLDMCVRSVSINSHFFMFQLRHSKYESRSLIPQEKSFECKHQYRYSMHCVRTEQCGYGPQCRERWNESFLRGHFMTQQISCHYHRPRHRRL